MLTPWYARGQPFSNASFASREVSGPKDAQSINCRASVGSTFRGGVTAFPSSNPQPRNRGVVNAHGPANCPAAFASGHALECLGLLVIGQLRFAAEPRASFPRGGPAFVGSLDDAMAFVLGHRGQEGNKAAAERRGQIQVGLVDHLDEGAPGIDAIR